MKLSEIFNRKLSEITFTLKKDKGVFDKQIFFDGCEHTLNNITPKVAIDFRDWWMNLSTLERQKLSYSDEKAFEEFLKQYKG